mmetsp:Transcript_34170/g.39841  ORF Transcript_34170/g.39841 Transcript_34170/m.39841 type:complete len:252 (+) Transcript_34170:40-795(+)
MSKHLQTIEKVVKLLASTNGRDKSTRIFQYLFRFLEAFLLKFAEGNNSPALKDTASRFKKIASSMSLTRKVLRFGKELSLATNLNQQIQRLQNPSQKITYNKDDNFWYIWLSIIRSIMGFNYMFCDHYIYFIKVGIVKKNAKLYSKLENFLNTSWLIESILNMAQNFIEMRLSRTKVEEEIKNGEYTDKEVAEMNANLQNKLQTNYLTLFTCTLDATMAFGFLKKDCISFILLDFIGVITSLIGTHQAWPK